MGIRGKHGPVPPQQLWDHVFFVSLLTALKHLGMSRAETGGTDPVWSCKAQPVSFFRPETALGQFPCFSPLFPFLSPSLCVASQSMPGHFLGHCTSSWQSGVLLCFVAGFCGLFYFCFWVFILFYFILKAGDAQP